MKIEMIHHKENDLSPSQDVKGIKITTSEGDEYEIIDNFGELRIVMPRDGYARTTPYKNVVIIGAGECVKIAR